MTALLRLLLVLPAALASLAAEGQAPEESTAVPLLWILLASARPDYPPLEPSRKWSRPPEEQIQVKLEPIETASAFGSTFEFHQWNPEILVFPNPARGKRVTFRLKAPFPVRVTVRVFDPEGSPLDTLKQEGEGLLDLLWTVEGRPRGLYLYRIEVQHSATGERRRFPPGRLAVYGDRSSR